MRGRERGYHVLFGVALVALVALIAWWTVFFLQAIETERAARLGKLRHMALVTAMELGYQPTPPTPVASIPGRPMLRVLPMAQAPDDGLNFRAVPHYPDIAVRLTDEAVAEVDAKLQRRRLMFIGEGSLLFFLVLICTFMLYRLIRTEKRNRRRMEAFLGAVTHEMKTPLAGIQSLLQTFAAGRIPGDQLPHLLALGLKEGERLEHMVENILVAGRLRTDHHAVRPQPAPMRDFLDGFIEHRQRYLTGESGELRFHWDLDDEEIHAVYDATALHTVLENLVDNAFKYGGTSPVVILRARQEGPQVFVSVEDRGIGFTPEQAERLFVPFRRALSERHAAQHGTGLGLSIARALTRRMGGTLSAESEGPGQGARFTVTLEAAE